jgi:hypothetical protein
MNNSALSWYIETDKGFVPSQKYYAGSFSQGDTISISAYFWNNRWGAEDEEDINGLTLKLYFSQTENSVLLPGFRYSVDGSGYMPLTIDNSIGYIPVNKVISGARNDGSLDGNPGNYIRVNLRIPISEGITENLKKMFITPLASGGE